VLRGASKGLMNYTDRTTGDNPLLEEDVSVALQWDPTNSNDPWAVQVLAALPGERHPQRMCGHLVQAEGVLVAPLLVDRRVTFAKILVRHC
jgi:hypothetical protein